MNEDGIWIWALVMYNGQNWKTELYAQFVKVKKNINSSVLNLIPYSNCIIMTQILAKRNRAFGT